MHLGRALTCWCLCSLALLGCSSGDDSNLDEASSTGESTSDETGGPSYGAECPESDVAAGYVALDLIGSLAMPVDCTMVTVEPLGEPLTMALVMDCDPGPTSDLVSLEITPATVQPALAVDQPVLYGAESHFLGCFSEDSFVMREPGGDLIVAGLFSDATHVELDLGSAGVLALDYVANDGEDCLRLDVTVAGQTTRVAARSTQAIQAGDQTYQLDVGPLRTPMPEGDDCGGDFRLFNVLVVRVP